MLYVSNPENILAIAQQKYKTAFMDFEEIGSIYLVIDEYRVFPYMVLYSRFERDELKLYWAGKRFESVNVVFNMLCEKR